MFCENCGAQKRPGSRFCHSCGHEVAPTVQPERPADEESPAVLAGATPGGSSRTKLIVGGLVAGIAVAAAGVALVLLLAGDADNGETGGLAPSSTQTTTVTAAGEEVVDPPGPLFGDISAAGLGDLYPGMPVEDAEQELGAKFKPIVEDADCGGLRTRNMSVSLLVYQGSIGIIYVNGPGYSTPEGIEIGDTGDDVRSAYPDGLTITPHEYYPKGEYLKYDPPDKGFNRLQFDTDDHGKVVSIRSGLADVVSFVEGCV